MIQYKISSVTQDGAKGILSRHRPERITLSEQCDQPHSQALNHARCRHQGSALGPRWSGWRRTDKRPYCAPWRPRLIPPDLRCHWRRGRRHQGHGQPRQPPARTLHPRLEPCNACCVIQTRTAAACHSAERRALPKAANNTHEGEKKQARGREQSTPRD